MNFEVKTLSSAVRVALAMGAVVAVAASGTALAQDPPPNTQNATQLKSVVVTGSLIRRVDLETANPVVTVDRAAIVASGKVTVGDLMQDLPAMTGGHQGTQVNNGGGPGSTTISLRGLGSKRSLILVDGHRVVSDDVNSIPASMIERIEVLTTGATAIYGSDAIGGVVNFITRNHYQGAQFTVDYGKSAHDDGARRGYTFTFGQTSDKGSIVGGVEYHKQEAILGAARDFTKNSITVSGTPTRPIQQFIGGSTSSPFGYLQIPPAFKSSFAGCKSGFLARNPGTNGMDPVADYHCYQTSGPNTDKYNFAPTNIISQPQERTNLFVLGSYALTDHVSAYLDAYVNKTKAAHQLAPGVYTTAHGVDIAADNYWNPFGANYSRQGYKYGARLASGGTRGYNFAVSVGQFSTGLKGDLTILDQDWNWDVGMDYGHRSETETNTGLPNTAKLYTGPSFLDPATGVVTCGTPGAPITGCDGNFNPFVLDAPGSVAALRAAEVPAISNFYSQEKVWRANVNGGLFNLPAGTAQLALGAAYRQEHTVSRIDPMLNLDPSTGTCILGTHCSSGLQGGFNVKEIYGELFVPILNDLPGIRSLNVTIGDRYSRYSTFGSANNEKFAVEWKPIDDLLLRGTVAEVLRAPDISEVFRGVGFTSVTASSDPCDGYTGNPVNHGCVNVPTDGSFVDTQVASNNQVSITSSGSAYAGFPIKPEAGKTFDFGAVYSPSWLSGLSVTVDAWHLYLNNIISQVGLQSLLNLCTAGQMEYCALIHRIPSGPQQGQIGIQTIEPTGNLGSVSVGGVDGSVVYRLPQTAFGSFNFRANATYLSRYDQNTAPGTPGNTVYHDAGHALPGSSPQGSVCPGVGCLFPRIRAQGSVNWQMDDWSASWRVRFIGKYRNGSLAPDQDVHPAGPKLNGIFFDYPSTIYHAVQVGYDFKSLHTRLDFGVDNLFDKLPPYNPVGYYDLNPTNFDYIGRYYWGRVTVSF